MKNVILPSAAIKQEDAELAPPGKGADHTEEKAVVEQPSEGEKEKKGEGHGDEREAKEETHGNEEMKSLNPMQVKEFRFKYFIGFLILISLVGLSCRSVPCRSYVSGFVSCTFGLADRTTCRSDTKFYLELR